MFHRRWIRRLLQQITPPDRNAISAQYWSELNDLLLKGEISLAVARRVEGDMFEAGGAGQARRLNDRAWQIVLDGRRANLDRAIIGVTEKF